MHGVVPRPERALRGDAHPEGHRGGAGRRVGRTTTDVQTTGRRRVRLDHRGRGDRLRRDGPPSRRPAWLPGAPRPRAAANHPFTLRYGDAEAVRLAQPAAIEGRITSPW